MSDKKDGPNRLGHAAVALGQTLLVWGGFGVEETSLVERFDVVSTTWRDARRLQGDSLPVGLRYMAVTSDGETGYVFGGKYSGGTSDMLFAINLTSLECREVVPSPSYRPGPRSNSAMVYSEGRLVMYGGTGSNREVEVIDLNKNTWSTPDTTGETPPVLRSGHTLTSVDSNRAVLFGGYDGGNYRNEAYLLDMESWRWREVKTSGRKPPSRAWHTASCIADTLTGRHPLVMVVGGYASGGTPLSDVWLLDVSNESWSEVTLPTPMAPRRVHSGVVFGVGADFRVLVLVGGGADTTLLLLGKRGGSWVVERVVDPYEWQTPDDSLRNQLRRLTVFLL